MKILQMKYFQTEYGSFHVLNTDTNMQEHLEMGKVPDQDMIETHLLAFVSRASSIIHVGSGIGVTDVLMTKLNPSINIYSFEPRDKCFCLLSKNIAANNCENIVILNNILGHMTGYIKVPKDLCTIKCDLEDVIELCNGSFITDNDQFCFLTLDSLNLRACDLMYINMPGFEYMSIVGGLATIKKYKPVICYHTDPNKTQQVSETLGVHLDSPQDILERLEYKVSLIAPNVYLAIPLSFQLEQIEGLVDSNQHVISDSTQI